jgi:hypothetical protein
MTEEIFQRHWVVQEVSAATKNRVDIATVRETDQRHGAMPLNDLKVQCPSELAKWVFQTHTVDWHRDIHFKSVAVIQLMQRILVQDDPGKWARNPPRLILPNTVTQMKFGDPDPLPLSCLYHCYCSNQPFQHDLQRALVTENNAKLQLCCAGEFAQEHKRRELISSSYLVLALLSPQAMQGAALQADLQYALEQGKKVVVMHDGGMASSMFNDIVTVCPQKIVDLGLFSDLALEWHYEKACREVSVHLLWHKINALCGRADVFDKKQEQVKPKTNSVLIKLMHTIPGKEGTSHVPVRVPPKNNQTKNQVAPQLSSVAINFTASTPVDEALEELVL